MGPIGAGVPLGGREARLDMEEKEADDMRMNSLTMGEDTAGDGLQEASAGPCPQLVSESVDPPGEREEEVQVRQFSMREIYYDILLGGSLCIEGE